MKKLLLTLTGLLIMSAPVHAQEYKIYSTKEPGRTRSGSFFSQNAWDDAHIKLVNRLDNKYPVEFVLYKKDSNGNLTPVKNPDANGDDTTTIASYRVNGGDAIYFYIHDFSFRNATDKCIYRIEAYILDPATGKRTNEWWYGTGTWCKETSKYAGIQPFNPGKVGWVVKIRDVNGKPLDIDPATGNPALDNLGRQITKKEIVSSEHTY